MLMGVWNIWCVSNNYIGSPKICSPWDTGSILCSCPGDVATADCGNGIMITRYIYLNQTEDTNHLGATILLVAVATGCNSRVVQASITAHSKPNRGYWDSFCH